MRAYELMVLINPEIDERVVEGTLNKYLDVIRKDEGTVDNVDIWGRRKLAYEIQDLREGYYVIVHFNAEPDAPKEIERLLRISDDVLRYLIVVQEGSFMPVSRRSLDDEAALEREAEEAAEALVAEKEEEPVQEEAPVAEEAPAAEEEAPAEEAAEATEPEERTEA